jgi:hypothetical protein
MNEKSHNDAESHTTRGPQVIHRSFSVCTDYFNEGEAEAIIIQA